MIFLTFLVHVLQLKEVVSGLFDVNDNKQEFLLYRAMWDNSQHCWVKVNKMHDVLFVKSVQWMIGKDKYFCLSTASYIKEQNWKSNADTNIHYLYVFFFLADTHWHFQLHYIVHNRKNSASKSSPAKPLKNLSCHGPPSPFPYTHHWKI